MRLIDADALKKALKSNCTPEMCHDYGTNWCEACCHHNDFEDLIDNAETVEPERPQGEWDYEQVAFYGVCSNCGVAVTSNLADIFLYEEIGKCPYKINFCPNCGADMRGSVNYG